MQIGSIEGDTLEFKRFFCTLRRVLDFEIYVFIYENPSFSMTKYCGSLIFIGSTIFLNLKTNKKNINTADAPSINETILQSEETKLTVLISNDRPLSAHFCVNIV